MATLRIALLAACGSLVLAAPADAQDTRIVLGGPAAKGLSAAGVTVTAKRPATVSRGRVILPPTAVAITGATATVDHAGALTLRAGRRSVTLRTLRVTIGARSSLSAQVGGTRRTIATIAAPAPRRAVDSAGTYLTEAPLVLTGAIVRLLRAELKRPALRAGRLGRIDLEASAAPAGGDDLPGAPTAPTVTGPPTPGGATTSTRPASAVTITGGTVRWAPRASWVGYLASSGEADSAAAQAPAVWDAAAQAYTLPISGGWFDAATGGALVATAGATDFRWTSHSLDLSFADWTFDLAAPTPKAVVTAQRAAVKGVVGTRQPIGLVRLNGVAPTVSGSTVTWSDVPMSLAAEGVTLYRAYLYDSDEGRLTISATLG